MSEQPTKKWMQDQINKCVHDIHRNEGVIILLNQMLERGIYVEEVAEGQKGVSDAH